MTSPTERAVQPFAVHGDVDTGFGPVLDAFTSNFAERGDLGAACAVYVAGRPVVDIWAGVADARTGRTWEEDTAAVIFSCSKGIRPLLGDRSFGHDGAGGQLAFADDEYVGFAYLSNQMGGLVDARATGLTAAVKSCLVGAK